MKKIVLLLLFLNFAFANVENVGKNDISWWQQKSNDIKNTWNSNEYEIYVPFYTWHPYLVYHNKKNWGNYNNYPWGGGVGKTYKDGNNEHSLLAMFFLDSHSDLESVWGYKYTNYQNTSNAFKFGWGYLLGGTNRKDILHYTPIPVPVPLPFIAIKYKNISIETTFVPTHFITFSYVKVTF